MKRLVPPSAAPVVAGFFVLFALSCATKKDPPPAPPPGTASTPPRGHGDAFPPPAPAPELRYTATVRVEGGEATQTVIPPKPTASPTAAPAVTPTLAPPATTPPSNPNVFSQAWGKIFPPKSTPPPVATASGLVPDPSPTPIMVRNRPSEGFLTRQWHAIFPKKLEPPAAAPPSWVGTIKLVNARDGYALIDAQNAVALTPGETLNSVGSGTETGVIRITADRNPPFFIADLVSGKPQPGDRVYSPKP